MDFIASQTTFTISPESNSVEINISVVDDEIVENTEYFDLFINSESVSGALRSEMRYFTQVKIRDSDSKFSYIWMQLSIYTRHPFQSWRGTT